MQPTQEDSNSRRQSRKWKWTAKVKKNIEKLAFEWEVSLKNSTNEFVKSPSFWHSGSTEWCIELHKGPEVVSLTYHLLSVRRATPVEAELMVSLLYTSGGEIRREIKTFTLTKPERFGLMQCSCYFDKWKIRGEVIMVSNTLNPCTEPYSLPDDLASLLDTGDMSDVVLCAGGKEFRAHTLLLSARSPVFAAMFCHDTQEAQTRRVNIEDVDTATLRELLRYVYTGSVPHMEEMGLKLLMAADKYRLVGLKELCGQELAKCVTVDNATDTAIVALKHSCEVLKQSVIGFIKTHFASVIGSAGWANAVRKHGEIVVEISRLIADNSED